MILENTRAFLALIEHSEGTGRDPHGKPIDAYRTCFGYRHTIQSFADHPAVTREWSGEVLPEAMCRKAGIANGPCRSTAAGRYQLIRPTWLGIKARLRLPDFSPDCQDRAALYLISNRGALEDVHAGRIRDAMTKCRAEWASLPGAGYGQREVHADELVAAFLRAGGTTA